MNTATRKPKSEHALSYDYARHCAAVATACYFDAVKQYRAKEIGTIEFCEVRKAHEAALRAFDAAERVYIDRCNETGEH